MPKEDASYPTSETGQPRTLESLENEGGRRFSRSVARNREVIREALLDNIDADAAVLEIGSGTGEHGIFVTEQAGALKWTFSDTNDEALSGITAWMEHTQRATCLGPYKIDASRDAWGQEVEAGKYDVIFTANVAHIAPFSFTEGLFNGAARLLSTGGKLVFYGPFARNGKMVASNMQFDADLKRRDAEWGVRDLETELIPLAHKHGLSLDLIASMPKNNLMLFFSRA